MNFTTRLVTHEMIGGAAMGLFLAVLGVFFLQKGLDVWQIGLVFGTMALSAALFELPFGAAADIYGRIRVWQMSRLAYLVAIPVMIFSDSFWLLMLAATLSGLSQALETGSIDAWVVERLKEDGEEENLQSFLSIFQSAMATGIALGAVAGGYIPGLMPALGVIEATEWNFVFIGALLLLQLLLSPLLFHEGETVHIENKNRAVSGQITNALRYGFEHGTLRALLVLGLFLGLVMASIEAYWQPRLVAITGEPIYEAFGWITAGYFAMAIVGPMLIGVIAKITGAGTRLQLMAVPILLGIVLILFSRQENFVPFVSIYLVVMLVSSMISPPANTLLNKETPDEIRSTMQSIFSFIVMIGGTISSFGFAPVVHSLGIAQTWGILATIFLIAAIALTLLPGLRDPNDGRG